MIEVRVRDQNKIDGGKVGNAQSRTSQTFQHEKPPREIGVDDDVLAADLYEEAGVPDERDTEFTVGDQPRLVSLTGTGSDSGATDQASELRGALTKSRIP